MVSIVVFSSHLRRGYNNNMNMYGLRVSPCMVLLLICPGGVIPKCTPENEVVECVCSVPPSSIVPWGTLGLLLG